MLEQQAYILFYRRRTADMRLFGIIRPLKITKKKSSLLLQGEEEEKAEGGEERDRTQEQQRNISLESSTSSSLFASPSELNQTMKRPALLEISSSLSTTENLGVFFIVFQKKILFFVFRLYHQNIFYIYSLFKSYIYIY